MSELLFFHLLWEKVRDRDRKTEVQKDKGRERTSETKTEI